MKQVTTAIVGLGYWGPNLLRNFVAHPSCNLKWACDTKAALLEKTRAHYPAITYTEKYEDVLKDPDVSLVLIATPTASHFPLAKAALEAGKHIFIEKPMCGTSAEAQELSALAKKKSLLIFVDHTFAFAPAVVRIQEAVQKGQLGDLLYFDSTRINLGIIQPDTNVLWDLAIHDLSILHSIKHLSGVNEVSAHGSQYYGAHAEVGHLHLKFKDNFMASVHVSWLSPVKIRQTILAGSKAMITYDDTEPSEKIRLYDKGIVHNTEHPNPMLPTYRSGDVLIPALAPKETLWLEADDVLRCILEKKTPRVSGDDAVVLLKILEAADVSLAKKASVHFTS